MELVTSGPVAAPHMPVVSTTAPLAPDPCVPGAALLDVLLPAALHSLLPLSQAHPDSCCMAPL